MNRQHQLTHTNNTETIAEYDKVEIMVKENNGIIGIRTADLISRHNLRSHEKSNGIRITEQYQMGRQHTKTQHIGIKQQWRAFWHPRKFHQSKYKNKD